MANGAYVDPSRKTPLSPTIALMMVVAAGLACLSLVASHHFLQQLETGSSLPVLQWNTESTVTVDTAVPVTDPLRTNAPTFTPIASSNAGHPSVNPPAVSTPYTSNVAPVHRDALIPPTPVASTDSAADPALARGPDGQYIDPIRADQALARLRIRGLVVDAINKQQRPRVSNEGQQPSLPSQPTASTPESAPAIGPAPSAWASSSKFDKYLSEGVSFLRRVVSTPVQPASNYEALRDLLAPELTLEMPLLISSNPRAPKGPHPPEKPMRETDPVPDLKRYASHFSPVPASDATWKSTVREEDVVMITASTGSFSAGVHEIAASLQYWEPDRLLIVYDLDMTATQRSAIKLLCNVVLMPPLREMYPQLSHQIFFPRSYAWKAMCIYDALTRWPAVFWSDVRSILTAPLQPLASLLVKHGYVMMKGQDEDASRRIYQGTAAALGVQSSWFKDLPSFSGNTQAYVRNGPLQDVMLRYTECSVKVNTCMAPQGASLSNHRFDQAVLTVLCYKYHGLDTKHFTYYLAARPDLSTDPRKPSESVIWTTHMFGRTYRDMMGESTRCGAWPRAP